MILDAHQKMHGAISDQFVILIKDYCRYTESKETNKK